MANTSTEKVANVFSKMFNPQADLDLRRTSADAVFEPGKTYFVLTDFKTGQKFMMGDDVRMQLVFSQIEMQSPIYQVCIQKRTAGVLGREWDITTIDESGEAKKQQEAVKEMMQRADTRNEDGLTEALKHLVMSAFRGRSAIKPFFDDNGDLLFKRLNNWNVLEYNGHFYWNPSSEQVGWFDTETPPNVVSLPKDEICYLTDDMPIDVPGLMLYLRQLVGEDQWARFVEKQGIPQVVINTPNGTPDNALNLWN